MKTKQEPQEYRDEQLIIYYEDRADFLEDEASDIATEVTEALQQGAKFWECTSHPRVLALTADVLTARAAMFREIATEEKKKPLRKPKTAAAVSRQLSS
jgi:3-phenylpropionate/cinnamic acid dioxygenase small subunit